LITAGFLIISVGEILNYPWRIGMGLFGLVLTFTIFINALNLNKKAYHSLSYIISAALLLFVIAFPYDKYFLKKHDKYPSQNVQQTASKNTRSVLYFLLSEKLMTSPDQNSRQLARILPLDSAIWYGSQKGSWIELSYQGYLGWVLYKANEIVVKPAQIRIRMDKRMSNVNLRTGSSTKFNIIRALENHETLIYIKKSRDNKWIFIKDQQGKTGWVWKDYFNAEKY
jgi:SH3-like domain-containing protein